VLVLELHFAFTAEAGICTLVTVVFGRAGLAPDTLYLNDDLVSSELHLESYDDYFVFVFASVFASTFASAFASAFVISSMEQTRKIVLLASLCSFLSLFISSSGTN